jgi:hypothetical protein
VGGESGQQAVAVTVDAEHGRSDVLVPSLIRPVERRRAQVTAARIQWHRSHHQGAHVRRVLADRKEGSTPAPGSHARSRPVRFAAGSHPQSCGMPQQPSPGLPGVRRPRPPSRQPLIGKTERRPRHHKHQPS